MTTTASDNDGEAFFRDLLDHIGRGRNTPKFQVERAIGPILGLFIAEVMSDLLKCEVYLLVAEFPLRNEGDEETNRPSNQSKNIDWLLYDKNENELIFLELKTDRSSFSQKQREIYENWVGLGSNAWNKLDGDLEAIQKASHKKKKYKAYLKVLKTELEKVTERPSNEFVPKGIRVVYLVPKGCDDVANKDVFNFFQLPQEVKRHNTYWVALRNFLCSLECPNQDCRRKCATAADLRLDPRI